MINNLFVVHDKILDLKVGEGYVAFTMMFFLNLISLVFIVLYRTLKDVHQ